MIGAAIGIPIVQNEGVYGWEWVVKCRIPNPKEKIPPMIGRRVEVLDLVVMMVVPKPDMIPLKDNQYTKIVELILLNAQRHVLVKIKRIFKEMI